MSNYNSRLTGLAALALALSALALPSSAQDAPMPTADAAEQIAPPKNSPEALATAARNILELIETHRFRMRRIDAALAYYRSIGDGEHVRQFQLLREREQNSYQQSLEIYRRMLGDQDFLRIANALRDKLTAAEGEPTDGDGTTARRREAAAESEVSAAERALRVRREMAAQEDAQRERAAQQAAQERQQAIARARASQRMQLAQRLQQARNDQLEARAAVARRYQPSTATGATTRPAGAPAGASGTSGTTQGARPSAAGRPERP